MRISNTGKIGIGISSPVNILTVKSGGGTPAASWLNGLNSPVFVGFGESVSSEFVLAGASNTPINRAVFQGRRSRGTLAAPAVVATDDYITSFLASAYDGNTFQNPALVGFFVDDVPSTGHVPSRISFVTGTNSSDRKERLRVGSTGDFNFNDNQFLIEQSTGRIGIGTKDLAAKLTINDYDNTQAVIVNSERLDAAVNHVAIYANAAVGLGFGYGISSVGSYRGVYGYGDGQVIQSDINVVGVEGVTVGGNRGSMFGLYGDAGGGKYDYGVFGSVPPAEDGDASLFRAAGYFNGDVWAVSYNTISDRKFKTNIEPLQNSLERLMNLKAYSYSFKKDKNVNIAFAAGKQLGLIADEVKQVFPELVMEAVHPAKYGKDRVLLSPQVQYQSVNYIGLIPVVIASLQEQQKQNEGLIKQLEGQQKQIEELKELVNKLLDEKDTKAAIDNITLEQNNPNPLDKFTTIRYNITEGAKNSKLIVTDLTGKVIKQVQLGSSLSGTVKFDATGLSSGNYTYSIVIDGKIIQTKKMVVTKGY
jgi:hypothetical protein